MSASVDKAMPSKNDSSKVGAVVLKDGTTLEADLVIEGVGVAPATEYLKGNSAVQLEKDGSIATNESFEYQPSIDIRDLISLPDVMSELGYGPNGGLVYCFE